MSSFFEKLKKGMGEELSPEKTNTEETTSEENSSEKTNSEEIAPAFEDNSTEASFAKISFFKQENNPDEESKKEAVKKEKKPTRQNSLRKNSNGQEKSKKNMTEEKIKIETKEEEQESEKEKPEKKPARNAFGIVDAGGEKTFEPKGELAVDIYQTEKDFVIQSAIAGVKPEDIDILIEDDVITIKGLREKPIKEKADYFSQECFWGPFSKEIILPVEVDSGRAESVMKDGILTVRMPKINKERKRKITVFRDK